MQIDEIKSIARNEFNPGDVIFVRLCGRRSAEALERARKLIRAELDAIGIDNPVLVHDEEVEFFQVRTGRDIVATPTA